MGIKLKVFLWLAIPWSCACVRVVKKQPKSNHVALVQTLNTGIGRTFIDSIFLKMDLSTKQIKSHTVIDKIYIDTNVILRFSGDTIYYPGSPHLIAIINGYGPNCSDKFLLVYDRAGLKNTGVILAGNQCDEDAQEDYITLDYAVQNAKQFYVEETDNQKNKGHKTKVIVTDQYYQIDKNGKIDSLKEKIKSITYHDPDEDGD